MNRDKIASVVNLPSISDLASDFRTATPFPHIVVDDFIDPVLLETVRHEVGLLKPELFHNSANATEVKLSLEDASLAGPSTFDLFAILNSGAFLTILSEITTPKFALLSDPYLRGGGIHRLEKGGFLGRHVDFPRQQSTRLKRQLNLLLFLNKGWESAWGGALTLYERKSQEPSRRILPEFNRMVLFETNRHTPHGVPEKVCAPTGVSRNSLALYYYVNDESLGRRLLGRASRKTTQFR